MRIFGIYDSFFSARSTGLIRRHNALRFTLLTYMALSAGLVFGYHLGCIAPALEPMQMYFPEIFPLEPDQVPAKMSFQAAAMAGITTASGIVGATTGAILGGKVTDLIGRKWSTGLLSVVGMLAALMSGVLIPNYYVVVFARFIVGLAVGLSNVCCPLWVAEFADDRNRGLFGALYNVGLNGGILVGYIVGLAVQPLGNESWRVTFGGIFFIFMLLFIAFLWIPESETWKLALDKRIATRKSRKGGLLASAPSEYELTSITSGPTINSTAREEEEEEEEYADGMADSRFHEMHLREHVSVLPMPHGSVAIVADSDSDDEEDNFAEPKSSHFLRNRSASTAREVTIDHGRVSSEAGQAEFEESVEEEEPHEPYLIRLHHHHHHHDDQDHEAEVINPRHTPSTLEDSSTLARNEDATQGVNQETFTDGSILHRNAQPLERLREIRSVDDFNLTSSMSFVSSDQLMLPKDDGEPGSQDNQEEQVQHADMTTNSDPLLKNATLSQILRDRSTLKLLAVGYLLTAGLILTGVNTFDLFQPLFFADAGLDLTGSMAAGVTNQVINVLSTIAAIPLIGWFKRRTLVFFSLTFTTITMIVMSLNYLFLDSPWRGFVAMVCTAFFYTTYNLGLSTLYIVILTELPWHERIKDMAIGVFAGLQWLFSCIIGLTFLPLSNVLGEPIVFGIIAGHGLLVYILLIILLPETKPVKKDKATVIKKKRKLSLPSLWSLRSKKTVRTDSIDSVSEMAISPVEGDSLSLPPLKINTEHLQEISCESDSTVVSPQSSVALLNTQG